MNRRTFAARGLLGLIGLVTAPLARAAPKPRNVTPPGISGTPVVGNTLTVIPGVWR
jgi:hypothetical protein